MPAADWVAPMREALLKAWPALFLAAMGAAWPALRAWRKARRIERERVRLERKALRYLLDADRHVLHLLVPAPEASELVDVGELARQKFLISEVREELWIADGHTSSRATDEAATEILKVITRTQAIRAKEEAAAVGQPPMFKAPE